MPQTSQLPVAPIFGFAVVGAVALFASQVGDAGSASHRVVLSFCLFTYVSLSYVYHAVK